MQRSHKKNALHKNSDGMAVVEATFAFPIMFMIFFALVLLAIYLPQRTMLQRATQFAATAIATEMSDTWVYFDASSLSYERYGNHTDLRNGKGGVYVSLFRSVFSSGTGDAIAIVEGMDQSENISFLNNGNLTVTYGFVNYIVYKEVVVTATRSIPLPVNLSIIRMPTEIELVVESTAVVQNGDEFIRSIDLAVDFVAWIRAEFPAIDNIFEKVSQAGSAVNNFFGL